MRTASLLLAISTAGAAQSGGGSGGSAGGAPAVIGTAWIDAELPEGFWPKHWTAGDTVFMVMPRRKNEVLLDALQRPPDVREFLR